MPDTLTADVAIEFVAPDVTTAMNQTNDRQQAVINALTGGGIDAKDISTTQVSLQPQYADNSVIAGYRASNSIQVKIRKLDKAQMLRFSTCNYLEEGHHIILEGASGNGKTYIACALGNAACRRFKRVRYIRMPELLDEMSIARNAGDLKKLLKTYRKMDLLILDEWLIRPLSPQESYDVLEIVESRCTQTQHGTMIFCTQFEPDGWYKRINPDPESDSPISEAIMDRVIHNSYEIMIQGNISMRERHGLKAQQKKGGGADA